MIGNFEFVGAVFERLLQRQTEDMATDAAVVEEGVECVLTLLV